MTKPKTALTEEMKVFMTTFFVVFCLIVFFFSLPDAPVHPPVSETHPYDDMDSMILPPDAGYGCKMVDGVVHVFTRSYNMDKYGDEPSIMIVFAQSDEWFYTQSLGKTRVCSDRTHLVCLLNQSLSLQDQEPLFDLSRWSRFV